MQEQMPPKIIKQKLASVQCNLLPALGYTTQQKIINQVQFYFSDANLKRDKYLKNLIKSNKRGWVDLKILLSFRKLQLFLRQYGNQLNQIQKLNSVLQASQLLRVNLTQVRRAVPFTQQQQNQIKNTVYIQNIAGIGKDKLLLKLTQYTKVYKLSYKYGQSWAFADVEQPKKLFQINNLWHQDLKVSIRFISYQKWLQYKQDFKSVTKQIRRLQKMIRIMHVEQDLQQIKQEK